MKYFIVPFLFITAALERLTRLTVYRSINHDVFTNPNKPIFINGFDEDAIKWLAGNLSSETGFIKIGFFGKPGMFGYLVSEHLEHERVIILLVQRKWRWFHPSDSFRIFTEKLSGMKMPLFAVPVSLSDPLLPTLVNELQGRKVIFDPLP